MEFIVNGKRLALEKADVESALRGVAPDDVRQYGVEVNGLVYPVKQALAVSTGLSRTEFQSMTARHQLGRLGLRLVTAEAAPDKANRGLTSPVTTSRHAATVPEPAQAVLDPHGWPWEGHVQALFVSQLASHGWHVTGVADTSTKEHGVDVLAQKGERRLGAEAKGWPSRDYADPRRRGERKPTQPTLQAGHWYSQAVMKALMLLDSHPGRESLVVLPDFPRYRDLATRTATGLRAAGVHVIFVREDGTTTSETWEP